MRTTDNKMYHYLPKPIRQRWCSGILILLLFAPLTTAWAQEAEEEGKKKARISLEYIIVDNTIPSLEATVKTKVDRAYESVSGVKVYFYQEEMTEENRLGSAETNKSGTARLTLPAALLSAMDTLSPVTYYAAIEQDPGFEDQSRDIQVWRSFTELTLEEEDTIRWVRFFIGAPDSSGTIVPVADVNARIFVKRLFGLLPISEDFEVTDEEGYLIVEFPLDIPGDADGNVTIVAQLSGHESFGTLRTEKTINWGATSTVSEQVVARQMWASRANAPIYLIILVNAVILGIWGTLFYIMYQMIRIKRMGNVREAE